eukprot:1157239-Pelagomonas_calceolata.AAC.11
MASMLTNGAWTGTQVRSPERREQREEGPEGPNNYTLKCILSYLLINMYNASAGRPLKWHIGKETAATQPAACAHASTRTHTHTLRKAHASTSKLPTPWVVCWAAPAGHAALHCGSPGTRP